MDLAINENLEIVNADKSRLENMRRYNNTIDNGAISILEGLEEFCDCMLEKYEEQPRIPYEKLFCALKQVISSALDNDDIRDAIMTGIISEKRNREIIAVEEDLPKAKAKRTEEEVEEIREYAANHNKAEIMKKFNFDSITQTRNFLNYHKIKSILSATKTTDEKELERVRELAKNLKLGEIAKICGKTSQAMGMYLMRHHIEYVRGR